MSGTSRDQRLSSSEDVRLHFRPSNRRRSRAASRRSPGQQSLLPPLLRPVEEERGSGGRVEEEEEEEDGTGSTGNPLESRLHPERHSSSEQVSGVATVFVGRWRRQRSSKDDLHLGDLRRNDLRWIRKMSKVSEAEGGTVCTQPSLQLPLHRLLPPPPNDRRSTPRHHQLPAASPPADVPR